MQLFVVQIADSDFIETWSLTKQVARAFHPIIRGSTGLNAVVGKLVPLNDAFDLRESVSKTELQELAPLLELLPPLREDMSEYDRDVFAYAYASLPNRLVWKPVIASYYDVVANNFKIDAFQQAHLQDLRELVEAGKLTVLDDRHTVTDKVGLKTYISKKDSVRYLKQRHIAYSVVSKDAATVPIPIGEDVDHSANVDNKASRWDERKSDLTVECSPSFQADKTAAIRAVETVGVSTAVAAKGTKPVREPFQRRRIGTPTVESPTVRPRVLLKRQQVQERIGMSRSAIYDKLDPHSPRYDPSFPKQYKVGVQAVCWDEVEINCWFESRVGKR